MTVIVAFSAQNDTIQVFTEFEFLRQSFVNNHHHNHKETIPMKSNQSPQNEVKIKPLMPYIAQSNVSLEKAPS